MRNPESEKIVSEKYNKLLLWYPRAWRDSHGEAMLGAYLDYADNRGITMPSLSDKITFCLSGLRERLFSFGKVGTWARFWLFLGLLYSIFYSFTIAWAPELGAPGSIGPFANPAVITAGFISMTWIFAIINVRKAAARTSVISFITNLVVCVLGGIFGWLGPSPWAALVFAFFTMIPWIKIKF